jgi:hypothetical protein
MRAKVNINQEKMEAAIRNDQEETKVANNSIRAELEKNRMKKRPGTCYPTDPGPSRGAQRGD